MIHWHRLTMHNLHHLLGLMRRIRAAIVEDRYPAFLREFFAQRYDNKMEKVPRWAVTALRGVGVDLVAWGKEEDGDEGEKGFAQEVERLGVEDAR